MSIGFCKILIATENIIPWLLRIMVRMAIRPFHAMNKVYYTKSRGKLPLQEVDEDDGMECFMDGSDGCGGNAGGILHGTTDHEE